MGIPGRGHGKVAFVLFWVRALFADKRRRTLGAPAFMYLAGCWQKMVERVRGIWGYDVACPSVHTGRWHADSRDRHLCVRKDVPCTAIVQCSVQLQLEVGTCMRRPVLTSIFDAGAILGVPRHPVVKGLESHPRAN